jgi:hypothetical protein
MLEISCAFLRGKEENANQRPPRHAMDCEKRAVLPGAGHGPFTACYNVLLPGAGRCVLYDRSFIPRIVMKVALFAACKSSHGVEQKSQMDWVIRSHS